VHRGLALQNGRCKMVGSVRAHTGVAWQPPDENCLLPSTYVS